MWTLVYMAKNKLITDKLCAILKENDIIFKCRAIPNSDSLESNGYELLVPDAEVFKAQELIFETEIN